MRRSGGDASVALDHAVLNLDRAAHRVDDAAELDDAAVAGALDDAAVMDGDGRDRSGRCAAPGAAPESDPRRLRRAANSRRRRTPRSPRVFASRSRRYAAATVSAVSGRPGKASGGHRKDARGMSIIGLSMAALPCCTEEDVEAGSAAPRVDWPVYPRRAEHNTVAEGGNRRWAETARRPVGLVELADDREDRVRRGQQDRQRGVSSPPARWSGDARNREIQRRSRAGRRPSQLSQPVQRDVRQTDVRAVVFHFEL